MLIKKINNFSTILSTSVNEVIGYIPYSLEQESIDLFTYINNFNKVNSRQASIHNNNCLGVMNELPYVRHNTKILNKRATIILLNKKILTQYSKERIKRELYFMRYYFNPMITPKIYIGTYSNARTN